MPTEPTVLLSRRPRHVGEDWTTARSWLGGAPRLGASAWPRGKDGQPLHFAAQIDLGELAAKAGATSLPGSGSLAFFVGTSGSVVYVPESAERTPTDTPADTPELIESGGSPDWQSDASQRRLYPFWPLNFTALELPLASVDDDEDATKAQVAAIERHFKRRQYGLSASLAFAGPPIPDWWQIAIYFADELGKAVARIPEALQKEQKMLDWAHEQVRQAPSKSEAELKKAEATVAMYEGRLAKARAVEPPFRAFEIGRAHV